MINKLSRSDFNKEVNYMDLAIAQAWGQIIHNGFVRCIKHCISRTRRYIIFFRFHGMALRNSVYRRFGESWTSIILRWVNQFYERISPFYFTVKQFILKIKIVSKTKSYCLSLRIYVGLMKLLVYDFLSIKVRISWKIPGHNSLEYLRRIKLGIHLR